MALIQINDEIRLCAYKGMRLYIDNSGALPQGASIFQPALGRILASCLHRYPALVRRQQRVVKPVLDPLERLPVMPASPPVDGALPTTRGDAGVASAVALGGFRRGLRAVTMTGGLAAIPEP
jgi:hypothetical protein